MINKKVVMFMGIFFLFGFLLAMYSFTFSTGTGKVTSTTQQVQIVPLTQEQVNKVASTLLESEFIEDVPKKNPIALQFYDFKDGERFLQNGFLISENELLIQGEPTIYLYLHSKYISEMSGNNLCEVIRKANRNGDLDYYSDSNKASLLLKYSSLLKYKDCL